MPIFKKPTIKAESGRKREIPRGLFQKCPGCAEVVPEIELVQNQRVCPRCDYHFAQPAKERLQNLLEIGRASWRERGSVPAVASSPARSTSDASASARLATMRAGPGT